MNVLIIGAGMIGTHLLNEFNSKDTIYLVSNDIDIKYTLNVIENNILNIEFIEKPFTNSIISELPSHIEEVYICGGSLTSNYNKEKESSLKMDILIMNTVIELIHKVDIKNIIYVSTKKVDDFNNEDVSVYVSVKKIFADYIKYI